MNYYLQNNFKHWNEFNGIFVSIIITTIIICTISIIYNKKVRNYNINDIEKPLSGFVILVSMFVISCQNLVVSIMGKRFKWLTPYIMYIMSYIFVGSLLSFLGLEAPASSYTITFSMALVTFIMIYYFGIKYQKLSYFKKLLNPFELIGQFTPILSMSFRLFGNLLGGSVILGLFYAFFIGVQINFDKNAILNENDKHWISYYIWNPTSPEDYKLQYKYWWAGFNIFTTFLGPFLHLYFDVFDGGLQAMVFSMLTLSYWSEQVEHQRPSLLKGNDVLETIIRYKGKRTRKVVELLK